MICYAVIDTNILVSKLSAVVGSFFMLNLTDELSLSGTSVHSAKMIIYPNLE